MINYKDTLPEALYTRFDNNSRASRCTQKAESKMVRGCLCRQTQDDET